MVIQTKSFMTKESRKTLQSIHGKKLNRIYIPDSAAFEKNNSYNDGVLAVVLVTEEKRVIFYSESMDCGNAYCAQLIIQEEKHYTGEPDLIEFLKPIDQDIPIVWQEQSLSSIKILKDYMIWMWMEEEKEEEGAYELMEFESEVGVHFQFGDLEFMIMAKDSDIGFMETWIGKDLSWRNSREVWAENHMIPDEQLLTIQRVEIDAISC